ncbi:UDP-glycosyltransferase 73C3-like [Mercurialis annua]|uniref:UDP-glycosyltransferase 73C3-like n=1 Tax=Mercurialis annua TaxID=3986 RepID=UPI00216080F6|nr:UDP-glycosyltransferase 73C3-like [Mercurialis annua]
MASQLNQLHFVLIPLFSPGHLLPMIDMGKLLAIHGMIVTVVTTPLNAIKFRSSVEHSVPSDLKFQFLELRFPAVEAGLPEGCENMDQISSRNLIRNFYNASGMLQDQFEELFETLQPRPSCIIAGKNLSWTIKTAEKFRIPRLFFDGMGCFSFSCTHKLEVSKVHETVSRFETFVVPDLPDRVELTRAKLPEILSRGSEDLRDVRENIRAIELTEIGIIVNTFEELETEYIKEYKKVKGDKVWCIGPVSACNKTELDRAERGEKASINESRLLKWLDLKEPGSVIYACLGSICGLTATQLVELGLGLESSNQPFIWVIRKGEKSEELEKWVWENEFENRIKEKGIIIRGWSPQLLILSHKSIGGFLTHCGWNSTLEGVSAGVPIIACPLFAEQFYNEKLVVEVLKIGVSVGVEAAVLWGLEDKFGLVMKREQVKYAIEKVVDKGKEGEDRRKRARELGKIARNAIEKGGSSYINMEMLIQYVRNAII